MATEASAPALHKVAEMALVTLHLLVGRALAPQSADALQMLVVALSTAAATRLHLHDDHAHLHRFAALLLMKTNQADAQVVALAVVVMYSQSHNA